MTPSEPALRCARLVRIYPSATGETHALRGVDVAFRPGTVSVLMGPSGSGKSSLLSVLALRERQSGGELWVLGRDAATLRGTALRRLRARDLAWVPQRPTHALMPALTAREQLDVVARRRGRGGPGDLLDAVGLADRARARVPQLSGGEQQRLAVALAVVGDPAVVVADEPTAELDDESAALVLRALHERAAAGGCVVLATHDPRVVGTADRVLHLRHGVLSADRRGAGPAAAPIDPAGRVQLPPEALALFPSGRALVELDGDGVRLRPAPEDEHDGPVSGRASGPGPGSPGEVS